MVTAPTPFAAPKRGWYQRVGSVFPGGPQIGAASDDPDAERGRRVANFCKKSPKLSRRRHSATTERRRDDYSTVISDSVLGRRPGLAVGKVDLERDT